MADTTGTALTSQPEESLVRQAGAGDRDAFEELVRRHAGRLYAVLLRFTGSAEEAEESLQEALLRAWRGLAKFRGSSQFYTWLYRIGINEAKRRAGRRGLVTTGDLNSHGDIPDPTPGPGERAEQRAILDSLARGITQLPEEYRLPLVLRDIEGLSTSEAAAVMELGEAAFKSRLHRGRMMLRASVEALSSGE